MNLWTGPGPFESLVLPSAQKRYLLLHTDPRGQPAFVAEHNAPAAEVNPRIERCGRSHL